MTADELIHLISNQALNENMKEQHKLVIQDCCKELFKKKETLCKYKKITYVKSKAYFDESCDELCCSTNVKTRIVEIQGPEIPFSKRKVFPYGIYHTILDRTEDEGYVTVSQENDLKFTILKIEDA